MKKVLITGGSGFLGSVMALRLGEVYQTGITYASQAVTIESCQTFRVDFHNEESVRACLVEFQPEVVVHTAALSSPAVCEKNPEYCQQVNVEGIRMLLRHLPSPDTLFIFTSTDLVFDGTAPPYSERSPVAPVSVYGRSKVAAEQLIQQESKNYVILRPSLIYGPVAPSGKGSFVQWMDTTLKTGKPLRLFIDEFRTPVYAQDITEAVIQIISRGSRNRLYHLGGPQPTSRIAIGEKLAALRGYDPGLLHPLCLKDLDTGYPRPADLTLDCSLIQKELGLKLTSLDEGLRQIFS